jgi:hypothetical protein
MFQGDVARTSGPREIAVFENFEMHPFINDRNDQWSVEGEQTHAGAVSPGSRCGCSVEHDGG